MREEAASRRLVDRGNINASRMTEWAGRRQLWAHGRVLAGQPESGSRVSVQRAWSGSIAVVVIPRALASLT